MKYHISVNGQTMGPFEPEELINQCGLTMNSYIWNETMTDWQLASSVRELVDLLNAKNQGQPVKYCISINGQTVGPFEPEQLIRQCGLTMNSYVWNESMLGWQLASTVPELAALISKKENTIPYGVGSNQEQTNVSNGLVYDSASPTSTEQDIIIVQDNINREMQPQYQQPYQTEMQASPNMGQYIAACVLHLLFCLFMMLAASESIDDDSSTLSSSMLMLGAVSSLIIFIGYGAYCKSHDIYAPTSILVAAQIIFILLFLCILIDSKAILDKDHAVAFEIIILVAFLLLLIGRFLVGGKLISNGQSGVGFMSIVVAVSQIVMIAMFIVSINKLQSSSFDVLKALERLGAVIWLYIIATTLETLLAFFMFSSKEE